jgi:hypothetical protein
MRAMKNDRLSGIGCRRKNAVIETVAAPAPGRERRHRAASNDFNAF